MTKFNSSQWALVLFVALGSVTYGYSSSIISTTLGQPSFLTYFELDTRSNSAQLLGAINGLFYSGGLIGTLVSAPAADASGRRMAMFIGGALSFIGGGLQAGSVHIAMFMISRALTGVGIGMLLCLVPLYQSELSPPQIRGLLVGTHGVMLCVGYSIASWLGVGFYFVKVRGAQWRMPLAIQCIFPLLLCLGVLKVPESPRYLIRCERIEEAYNSFKSVHAFKEDESEAAIQLEFGLLHAQIQDEKEMATSYYDLLTQPSLRKRCLVGFLTCFAAQGTATMVISNYGPLLYASLGYNTIQQLCLSAGWITICPFGNLFNALVVDKIGRVPMLIAGFIGTTLCLVGECITVAIFNRNGDPKVAAGAVFFLFFHLVCFSSTIDATSYIYSAEIFPTPVRAKGLGISVSGLFVATILFLSGAPKAFESIGWKYYIVFMAVTTVMIFVAYFFFPETKGVPLEEMAAIFGDEIKYETSGIQILETIDDEKKEEATGGFIHDESSR